VLAASLEVRDGSDKTSEIQGFTLTFGAFEAAISMSRRVPLRPVPQRQRRPQRAPQKGGDVLTVMDLTALERRPSRCGP
jgi:hypothetical protein